MRPDDDDRHAGRRRDIAGNDGSFWFGLRLCLRQVIDEDASHAETGERDQENCFHFFADVHGIFLSVRLDGFGAFRLLPSPIQQDPCQRADRYRSASLSI